MTALVAPVTVRSVPWHRLGWVAWRRYRSTLIAVVVVLAALACYLVVTGRRMHTAYDAVASCRPMRSATCEFQWNNFHNSYGGSGLVTTILILLPGLIGAFAGAPVLARELETGTFRYAWTQGVGRMRWAFAIVAPAAVGVAAVMAGFGLLVRWRDQPLLAAGVSYRLEPQTFPVTGVAIAGWGLVAFALGVLAGVVSRRVVAALATSFAVWFGLAYAASEVRRHYEAPLTTTKLGLGRHDMPVDQWWVKDGVRVGDAQINQVLRSIGVQDHGHGDFTARVFNGTDPVQYLVQHGYTEVTSYQPDGRYWPFQWIETGWLVVISFALLATALWLLRRRSA